MDKYQEIPLHFEIPYNCLSTSGLLDLFWASYYGDPLTETTQRKLSKSEYAPLPYCERAHDPSWQRKLDRKLNKAISKPKEGSEEDMRERLESSCLDVHKWLIDEAVECDRNAVVEAGFEQMKRAANGERLVTGLWLRFEQIAIASKKQFPNEPKTIFFEYLLSYKRTWIEDEIEILLLMLVAFLEFESLCAGNRIGYLYEESMFREIPLRTWIPAAESGNLKTTRYCVLDYCLKNIFKDKTRTAERFRGEPNWNKLSELKEFSPLNIRTVIPYFGYGELCKKQSFILAKKVQFAYFFGWYQLALFESGIPAEEIVEGFSKIEKVREYFYQGLLRFVEQRNPT